MLREPALAVRKHHIHASLGRVSGEDNKMADSASRLTHLLDHPFISHLCSDFPQNKPRRLLPLQYEYKRQLMKILLNKQYPRVSQPLS